MYDEYDKKLTDIILESLEKDRFIAKLDIMESIFLKVEFKNYESFVKKHKIKNAEKLLTVDDKLKDKKIKEEIKKSIPRVYDEYDNLMKVTSFRRIAGGLPYAHELQKRKMLEKEYIELNKIMNTKNPKKLPTNTDILKLQDTKSYIIKLYNITYQEYVKEVKYFMDKYDSDSEFRKSDKIMEYRKSSLYSNTT